MNVRVKIVSVVLILFFSIGCNNKTENKRAEAEAIIKEWVGKTIVFPENIPYRYQRRDTVPDQTSAPYQILLYTDSTGCTSCRLGIDRWKELIEELEEEAPGQVRFLFYFQPKNEKELYFMLKRDRFEHPVYVDVTGELNRQNQLSKNEQYHCFLLDQDNKVLLIGNPTRNPAIKDLYKQVITGKQPEEKPRLTSVEVEQGHIRIPALKKGETTEVFFTMKNTGEHDLKIIAALSSCDCILPKPDFKPVPPGETTTISVKITPESAGQFEWDITVFCNIDGQETKLLIDGFVSE